MKKHVSRRSFLGAVVAAGAIGSGSGQTRASARPGSALRQSTGPALLGGTPGAPRAVSRRGRSPTRARKRRSSGVIRSGKWFRGEHVAAFETAYASLTGAKHCLATANGTSALITSLAALGIGPGDEVIVPPYTFIATVNAVLLMHALPVFVDTDLETFQIDARKVERRSPAGRASSCRCTSAARPPTSTRSWTSARRRGVPVRRGRVPGAPRRVARPQGGHLRQGGLLQFSGEQEPELRRGRRHPDRRRGARRDVLPLPQQQPRPAEHRRRFLVPQHRREPAHDRVPGRAADRADDAARGAGADARRERRVSHDACCGRSPGSRRRGCTTAARATPTTSTCSATTRAGSPGCRARRSSRRSAPKACPPRAATRR